MRNQRLLKGLQTLSFAVPSAKKSLFADSGAKKCESPGKKPPHWLGRVLQGALLAAFSLALFACATSTEHYRKIDAEMEGSSYTTALSLMESAKVKKNLYPKKNEILYYLDRGMIEHHAGLWEASSQDLQAGERLIEAAFTKSISQEISSFIANDNTRDYPGEDYEDLYINVFNALNYYHQGNLEGAMVEIRRLNEKLVYLAGKYEVAKEKVIKSNNKLSDNKDYIIEAKKFSNSALARYLGVLFYRAAGNRDSARIDLEKLVEAYDLAPSIYTNPVPLSLDEELAIPLGKARFNVISFTGLSPVKEEVNISIPLPFDPPNDWARLSLPQMINRPSAISRIEVILESADAAQDSARFELELLEDMGTVARETFSARYGLILLKSTARTIIKNTVSAGTAKAAKEHSEGLGLLVGIIGAIASNASEQADVRIARYFPAYAYVGGITIDPGTYNVSVNFYGTGGLVSSELRRDVDIKERNLNLTEFICLK